MIYSYVFQFTILARFIDLTVILRWRKSNQSTVNLHKVLFRMTGDYEESSDNHGHRNCFSVIWLSLHLHDL